VGSAEIYVEVEVSMSRKHRSPKRFFPRFVSLSAAVGAIGAALLTCVLHWLSGWPWLPAYLVALNAVTFALYALDKTAAKVHFRRVSERTLHAFAFAGGTLAALFAQGILRHKTAKRSFRWAFWALTVLQAALLAVFFWLRNRS
jgi:uncharacterized membrane protein YsdA (DUF1294 family)